jgi:hypothetical protein
VKKLVQVVEVENEGLVSLIGQKITLFCLNYIYTGTLVGINDTCVRLDNPSIVYETGDLCSSTWKDAQKLPNSAYIMLSCIESFTTMKE